MMEPMATYYLSSYSSFSLVPRPFSCFYLWWQKKDLVYLHRTFCFIDSQILGVVYKC